MSRLLPSESKPAMSEQLTACPKRSVRSNGITTRSRHGLSAASRTRMMVRPVFPSKAVRSTDDEIVIGPPSQHVARIGCFERDRAGLEIDPIHVENFSSRRLSPTNSDFGCRESVRTFCARTPRKGVRSRTLPFVRSQRRGDRFRRRCCRADKGCVSHPVPRNTNAPGYGSSVVIECGCPPSTSLAQTLSTPFLFGASQLSCEPSGEICGSLRAGFPKRTSRGIRAGSSAWVRRQTAAVAAVKVFSSPHACPNAAIGPMDLPYKRYSSHQ